MRTKKEQIHGLAGTFTQNPGKPRQMWQVHANEAVMLSVIIRTHNGENVLLDVLRPLVAAAAEGVVRDVVFLDIGSNDGTPQIADAAGATFLPAKGLPDQTDQALKAAHRGHWIMLLDQTTVLSPGWLDETLSFVERQERVRSARGKLTAVYRPEHEPEAGSADVRRRMLILAANRLFSLAKLSQGIVLRRADFESDNPPRIDWVSKDPSIRLTNLLRLRSRTHLAQPMEPLAKAEAAERSQGELSRAAL
jgi:glycosyltransferase involved in cell wall biosynthesis